MERLLAEIRQLLELKDDLAIALAGAGGKTSLMRYLAHHLPHPVVCTTSTKLSLDEAAFFDRHITWEDERSALPDLLAATGNVLVTGFSIELEGKKKLNGLSNEQMILLKQICFEKQLPLIIEADGSKRRPLKAPADWEPVIPDFTDLVIVVVGLAGLMKPLNEENVFRSQVFAQLTGVETGQLVDLGAILRYLRHPKGGLKAIPDKAKKFVLFNLARCDYLELVDRYLIKEELGGVFDGFSIEDMDLLS